MVKKKTAIIIGSGIAGLACAARLAAQGWSVQVFEKNAYPGGKLGLLEKEGFAFDTGPSLFTQPFLLEELFSACGKKLSDYFSYRALDEGTQYFWNDGTSLHAHPKRLSEELTKAGILHNSFDVSRYLHRASDLYKHIGSIFLDEPIHQLKTWLSPRILRAFAHLRFSYLTQNLHDYNTRQLRHPKLVQLFDRFATYNGSDPYRCPAMLSTIAHLELGEGIFYPQGGMTSIPKSVYKLCCDLGVTIHFETPVERILNDSGAVVGIQAGNEKIIGEVVISNGDVYYTYAHLLRDAQKAASIKQQEPSSSGLVFYWGVKGSFPQLRLHNIFFAEDYNAEFTALREGRIHDDPTVYVNITCKMESQHAPSGCENWFVLINAPAADKNPKKDKATFEQARKDVLAKLSNILRVDVKSLILTEDILTPGGIEASTGSYLGALYGTASNSPMAAFNRHPNQSSRYRGLYFCGGTVHPGGGIPLCLRSGRLAAEAALKMN